MYRRYFRIILLGGLPLVPADKVDGVQVTNTEADIQRRLELLESLAPTSGWERVKYMFSRDENGEISPYITNILAVSWASAFSGAIYGGYKKSQVAYLDFVRTNQASRFESHLDAKRRLQDKYALAFGKGAFQLAWRCGLFSFMFMAVANATAAYRNKDGILEYTCGGAAAGMSYRLHLGMRGVIVGGILGATLGTAGGVIANIILRLSGYSFTDIRNGQYMYMAKRNKWEQKFMSTGFRENCLSQIDELTMKIEADEKAGRDVDNLDDIEIRKK